VCGKKYFSDSAGWTADGFVVVSLFVLAASSKRLEGLLLIPIL
jgi:hypothetical protein